MVRHTPRRSGQGAVVWNQRSTSLLRRPGGRMRRLQVMPYYHPQTGQLLGYGIKQDDEWMPTAGVYYGWCQPANDGGVWYSSKRIATELAAMMLARQISEGQEAPEA